MIEITEEDVAYSESLLLPEGYTFDEERTNIIKCLETKDIKACPGSGKTTTLLAKLAIISTKMPLPSKSGVCVLTHTNVAINEIKARLGLNGAQLFDYPNNCSTIQKFINKYLTIPAYVNLFNKRPIRIDDEIYNETIKKEYYKVVPPKYRYGIEKKDPNLIYNMRFDMETQDIVKGLYGNLIYQNKESPSYKYLLRLKLHMLKLGVLCYDDAFCLANDYLDKYPQLKEVFSQRFSYVFIDEMQDTMKHQNELLNKLFDDSVIMQRIGDKNQSIYDNYDAEGAWEISDNFMSISESKRFSHSIANIVKNICVEPQDLIGNSEIREIQPTIIVFNKETINSVIPYFGEKILINELNKEANPVFKAIGWVTKEHEKADTLLDYWDGFSRAWKQRLDFDYLSSYLITFPAEDIRDKGASVYKQSILRGILKALRLMEERDNNERYFTAKSFQEFLRNDYQEIYEILLLRLADWCLAIQNGYNIHEEVKEFIETELKEIFNWGRLSSLSKFFERQEETKEVPINTSGNIFTFDGASDSIDIVFDSIHSVKGETHTATLYLETFFREYDIARIINYLKGNHKPTNKKYTLQNLKMSYVGLTRPSHMLCIAVHEETVKNHEQDLQEAGWYIEYVSQIDKKQFKS